MITQALTGILPATLSLSAATATCAAQCPLIPDGNATLEESERVALLSEFKFEALDKELARRHKKNLSSAGGDQLTMRDLLGRQQLSLQEENVMHQKTRQALGPALFSRPQTAGTQNLKTSPKADPAG
nr:hypothetical protein [Delftia acidovorans]